jgi:predicted RNA-binding Zn ribbon-like protein
VLWPVAHAATALFVDESKNRSRRWCSMEECGTHAKMRRYVARRAAKRKS